MLDIGQWPVPSGSSAQTEGGIVVTASWRTILPLTVFVVYSQVSETHTYTQTDVVGDFFRRKPHV